MSVIVILVFFFVNGIFGLFQWSYWLPFALWRSVDRVPLLVTNGFKKFRFIPKILTDVWATVHSISVRRLKHLTKIEHSFFCLFKCTVKKKTIRIPSSILSLWADRSKRNTSCNCLTHFFDRFSRDSRWTRHVRRHQHTHFDRPKPFEKACVCDHSLITVY